jgi:hypothetical protein
MVIDEVLNPLTVEAFVKEFAGLRWWRQTGTPRRFDALLSWVSLNDALEQVRVSADRVRMVRDGCRVPREAFLTQANGSDGSPLSSHGVQQMLAQGATLVVDAIDELVPAIRELAESFERVFRIRVGVNAYLGFGRQHGFDLHWDHHDTLILQIAGRKHWRVLEPTRLHPLRRDVVVAPPPPADTAPVWDGLLEAGSVLYMPRGWWHVATPIDEPSLHLTLGLCHPTGADLLEWAVARLGASESTREDLPHLAPVERQRAYVASLADDLRTLVASTSLDDYVTWNEARLPLRPRFTLPALRARPWRGDAQDAVCLAGARCLWMRDGRPGELTFELAGKRWQCVRSLRPALALLCSSPRPFADLLSAIDADARPALRTLFAAMHLAGELGCAPSSVHRESSSFADEGHEETLAAKSRAT